MDIIQRLISVLLFSPVLIIPNSGFATDDQQTGSNAPRQASQRVNTWRQETIAGLNSWVFIPPDPSLIKKVVIVLHGCSQTIDDLKKGGNLEPAATKFNHVVVLPAVPQGGVFMGCWDYYGKNHSNLHRHHGALIQLAMQLLQDSRWTNANLEIAIAGLSSGGGEAFVVTCLRPDLFRYLGLVASPILGSEIQDTQTPKQSAHEVAQLCRTVAGSRSQALSEVQVSVIRGDVDHIVAVRHSDISTQAWLELIGTQVPATTIDMNQLPGRQTKGSGQEWIDNRGHVLVSSLINSGLGHAWPAGNQATQSQEPKRSLPIFATQNFTNSESIDYPRYFFELLAR